LWDKVRKEGSGVQYDIPTDKLSIGIIDEDEWTRVPDSDDISISIMREVTEWHLSYIDISVVGDHPSRTEPIAMIQEELDIAILIGDEDILPTVMIHISMKILSNTRSSRSSEYRSYSPIYPIDLCPRSTMIDMSDWITEIDQWIGMEPLGRFSYGVTSSIGEEHRIVASPSDPWSLCEWADRIGVGGSIPSGVECLSISWAIDLIAESSRELRSRRSLSERKSRTEEYWSIDTDRSTDHRFG
jgi:hypothetical protein